MIPGATTVADFKVTDLGPHSSTRLALFGHTGAVNVSGGSEAGKSMLYAALCLLLTGTWPDGDDFPREAIREGAEECEVKAALPGLGVARVTLSRKGSWTRSLTVGQTTETFGSARDFAAKLGRLGELPAVARFIVAPVLSDPARARALLKTDLARPFRDVLLSALPAVDVREVVGRLLAADGHALKPSDPVELKAALTLQTAANSARDRAAGALDRARAALASLPKPADPPSDDDIARAGSIAAAALAWADYDRDAAEHARALAAAAALEERRATLTARVNAEIPAGPDAAEVERAQAVLDLLDAWKVYRAANTAHQTAAANYRAAVAERDRRAAARAELGERPVLPVVDIALVEGRITKAGPALEALRKNAAELKAAAQVAAAKVEELKSGGSACPTCGQSWTGHAGAIERAEVEANRAAGLAQVEAGLLARSEATLADLVKQRDTYRSAEAAVAAYDRALRAIGPDPVVPEIGEAPVAPAEPEDAARAQWADGVLAAYDRATTVRDLAEKDRERASRELDALETPAVVPAPAEPGAARPSAQDVEWAARVRELAASARGAAEAYATAKARAEADVKAAETEAAATAAEAVRVAALPAAIRRAPTEIAERQRAAFNLPPWLALRFPPKEPGGRAPEVELLIDGRPWFLASTGRRVLADLYLRAAVRKAAGLDVLPVFVDGAQDWSGEYPEVERAVYLWTTTEPGPLRAEIVEVGGAA